MRVWIDLYNANASWVMYLHDYKINIYKSNIGESA